ncbi:MAG: hypothetical protein IPK97_19825 [Ahniella sp.]|nr:hypothetical protein [Ahniella sp.]
MVGLSLDLAPAPARPARFLHSVPIWGVLFSVQIALLDPMAWTNRWHPGLIALVHSLLLGVIGNACLGALMQFLGAAAGSPVPGSPRLWNSLHTTYNLGVLLLVAGFKLGHEHLPLLTGSVLLISALGIAAGLMLAGLARGQGSTWLRFGLSLPLVLWPITALLGGMLVLRLAGIGSWSLPRMTDLHATLGVLGVFGLLLLAVGSVVLPMLLGTAPHSRRAPAWAIGLCTGGLALVLVLRKSDDPDGALAMACAIGLSAALWGLGRLYRRPHPRNAPLTWSWRFALVTLAVTSVLLWCSAVPIILALAIVLGVVLPTLVLSMLMEINSYLAWIAWHRAQPGHHTPSVHALVPDRFKWHWLSAQALSAGALLALAITPRLSFVIVAALLHTLAYVLLWRATRRPWQCLQRGTAQ